MSMLPFLAALSPVHNSLVDSPYDVQNRQAEQHVLQHARIAKPSNSYFSSISFMVLNGGGHVSHELGGEQSRRRIPA